MRIFRKLFFGLQTSLLYAFNNSIVSSTKKISKSPETILSEEVPKQTDATELNEDDFADAFENEEALNNYCKSIDDEVVIVAVTANQETANERKVRNINEMIGIAIDSKDGTIAQMVVADCLTDDAMNYFVHMVRQQYGYDMLVTNLIVDPEAYAEFDLARDGFQILFVPPLPQQKIGHWIAIHYVHS